MKKKLFEVKEEVHNKALEIVKAIKQKGKEALNKVSEFFGVKRKLMSIRENVREGIIETDKTLARGGMMQLQEMLLVSESECEYGAEKFEAYMKENVGEGKQEVKEVVVQGSKKVR